MKKSEEGKFYFPKEISPSIVNTKSEDQFNLKEPWNITHVEKKQVFGFTVSSDESKQVNPIVKSIIKNGAKTGVAIGVASYVGKRVNKNVFYSIHKMRYEKFLSKSLPLSNKIILLMESALMYYTEENISSQIRLVGSPTQVARMAQSCVREQLVNIEIIQDCPQFSQYLLDTEKRYFWGLDVSHINNFDSAKMFLIENNYLEKCLQIVDKIKKERDNVISLGPNARNNAKYHRAIVPCNQAPVNNPSLISQGFWGLAVCISLFLK